MSETLRYATIGASIGANGTAFLAFIPTILERVAGKELALQEFMGGDALTEAISRDPLEVLILAMLAGGLGGGLFGAFVESRQR